MSSQLNGDSLLSQLESDVSDNRHVLEQLFQRISSSLYIPLALEIIRQGTVRAEIVDRIFDQTIGTSNFERMFVLDSPFCGCCEGCYFCSRKCRR